MIVLNALRYLGLQQLRDIEEMTLTEYNLRMKAYQLRQLDEMRKDHELAWLMAQVQATDKKGKPRYKDFKSFFDAEKLENEILHRKKVLTEQQQRLIEITRRLQHYRKEVRNGRKL